MLEAWNHKKPPELQRKEEEKGSSGEVKEHKPDGSTWVERLMQRLRRLIRNQRGVSWVVFLVVAAILGSRYRKIITSKLSALALALASSQPKRPGYRKANESALSHLWDAIRSKLVQKVLLSSSSSIVYYKANNSDGWQRTRLPPNQPQMVQDVIEKLSEAGCSDVQVLPESTLSRFASPLLAALPFVYLGVLYRMVQHFSNQHNNLSSDSKSSLSDAASGQSTTTFADVAGLDAILPDVTEIVHYLQNPASFQALGARPPRGILLYGPPGCGKTLIARAVAGEAAVDAFVACNASDFVEVFVGRGAARVRHLFQQLRQQARTAASRGNWWQRLLSLPTNTTSSSPTARPATGLLFIDELDALAKTRSVLSSSDEREQTLMQLLTEMDGFVTHDDHGKNPIAIVVLAASNRADILDPAILRRFDRHIHVDYPDSAGRQAILQRHARGIRLQADAVDWTTLASNTSGMTGSDLRNVVNEAALLAVRSQDSAVRQIHLEQAISKQQKAKASSQRSTMSQLIPRIIHSSDDEGLFETFLQDHNNGS